MNQFKEGDTIQYYDTQFRVINEPKENDEYYTLLPEDFPHDSSEIRIRKDPFEYKGKKV